MTQYRYGVRQSKNTEPEWINRLNFWAWEYPSKGWEDLPDDHWKWKLSDALRFVIPRTICALYGHHSTPDMCNIPSHDYCARCMCSTPRDTNPFPKISLLRLRR